MVDFRRLLLLDHCFAAVKEGHNTLEAIAAKTELSAPQVLKLMRDLEDKEKVSFDSAHGVWTVNHDHLERWLRKVDKARRLRGEQ